MESGEDVVLVSAPDEKSYERTLEHGASLGLKGREVQDKVREALAEITFNILDKAEISGIIVVGGATAHSIFERSSISRIGIIDEIQPGIPLLDLGSGLIGITKAGVLVARRRL